MSQLATHIIAYVNSHRRLRGTHTDFEYTIDLPTDRSFDSICVLQASIPKSFFLITSTTNTFVLMEGDALHSVTITMEPGNYSRRSLSNYLTDLLRTNSPRGYYYTVTIPSSVRLPDTGKYLFSVQTAIGDVTVPPYTISFVFGSYYQPCESMGFERNTAYSFTAGVLSSVNVCRLQARSTVFIKSNAVDNGGTSILQAIFAAEPDFSLINFQVGHADGIQANRKELLSKSTNHFSFTITDVDDQILDTNGQNVEMAIMFWDSRRYKFVGNQK
jgi:hypothetical protein